jgi:hypothetical protein
MAKRDMDIVERLRADGEDAEGLKVPPAFASVR